MSLLTARIPSRLQIITLRLRRWFLVSIIIGVVTGLGVTALDYLTNQIIGFNYSTVLSNPVGVLLMPTFGLALAGLALTYLCKNGDIHGTEEVIKTYHAPEGDIDYQAMPAKLAASISTIGFGGSAGLEGPSIYIGAGIGSVTNRLLKFLGLQSSDVKNMIIAGSAAGISAIFKAPLTGIVFALEMPYKDDLAKESLIPSLIASVSSYLTLVSILGITPLFRSSQAYSVSSWDLIFAVVLGLVIGLAGKLFVLAYRRTEELFSSLPYSRPTRMAIGGLLTGVTGLVALWWFGSPMSLGIGYNTIGRIINESFSFDVLVGLFLLKSLATITTLASGGAGGIFIPMILLGGILGAILGKLLPFDRGHLFPIIGMPSFLAAGYKTPLAAVIFIAETTGSPHYIIPGLIAAAVGYVASGRLSVSRNQRWVKLTKLESILSTTVGQVMTRSVDTVPVDKTVDEFFNNYLLKFRHKSMPVVDEDGRLYGMIALGDLDQIAPTDWRAVRVRDVAVRAVHCAHEDQTLADVLNIMHAHSIDRIPVTDRRDPKRMVGIISSDDIVAVEELSKFWRERRDRA